jgi:hypothetical protein
LADDLLKRRINRVLDAGCAKQLSDLRQLFHIEFDCRALNHALSIAKRENMYSQWTEFVWTPTNTPLLTVIGFTAKLGIFAL